VSAPDGTFQGKPDQSGKVNEFLGIRYAQPPVGNLRWAPPVPVAPSHTLQNATRFGNHCPQLAGAFGNASNTEDCLFLNVYMPNDDHDRDGDRDHRPVMVWIHGGALVVGESDDYNATKLAQAGVIVVTINYRLGALGFMAGTALSALAPTQTSGNYGIEDQQEALRWVKRNIRAFGGDADRITIFGESAGGLSTYTNVVSPTAKGLFRGAIVESGSYQQTYPTLTQLEVAGDKFAAAVGCNKATAADTVSCLRGVSVATILQNAGVAQVMTNPTPNIDGRILTESLLTALENGRFNRVPLMVGTNHDEWNLFIALDFDLGLGQPVSSSNYPAAVAATIGTSDPTAVANVTALYPLMKFATPDYAVGAVGTDSIFACPSHFENVATSRFVDTFVYEFNDENAPEDFLPPVAGLPNGYKAAHASEIQYLFPTADPTGVGLNLSPPPLNSSQLQLSAQMVKYWTAFARHGNPNSPGTPRWEKFGAAEDNMQSLTTPAPAEETNFATVHNCAFWDAFAGRTQPTQ
jgi:para-nitrobenzyl esterase